jgi:hypothetical protein
VARLIESRKTDLFLSVKEFFISLRGMFLLLELIPMMDMEGNPVKANCLVCH